MEPTDDQVVSAVLAVVKPRLHRARGMLRHELFERVGASSSAALTFHASRCDRIVERVFAALKNQPTNQLPL